MAKKVLEIAYVGKDELSKTLKTAGLNADQLKRKLQEVNKASPADSESGGGGAKSFIKDLNSQLGKRSTLGQLGKIAMGAGAVGGLSYIVKGIDEAVQAATKLTREFQSGKISAGEMVDQIVRGVPVIGAFWGLGKSIREAFTGEQEEIDKINASTALQNILIEYTNTILSQQKKIRKEVAEADRQREHRTNLIGKKGYERESQTESNAIDDRMAAIKQKRDAEIESNAAAAKKELDEITKQKDSKLLTEDKYAAASESIKKKQKDADAKINATFAKQEADEAATSNAERDAKAMDALEKSRSILQSHQAETKSLETEARAERLRSLGKDLDAELLLIDDSTEKKKEALKKQIAAEIEAAPPGMRAAIASGGNAQAAAIDNAAAADRETARKKDSDSRQKDADTIREKQKQIEDQKAAREKYRPNLATLQEAGLFTSGLAAAGREAHDPTENLRKVAETGNKLQKELNEMMKKFTDKYLQGTQQPVTGVF